MNLTRTSPGANPFNWLDTPTVFVIDGDASAREGLAQIIGSAGWQPRMAGSMEEFLALPRLMTPGCILAELHLPGLTGLDLQRLVCSRRELPIIFLSGQADVLGAVQAMKRGAFELVTKPICADVLSNAIRGAIERSCAALNYLTHIQTLQARYASLSDREREVMSLVVSGRLNKQVAVDLGITEFTVKVHRGRAMRKMQARSFAELVTMTESLRREMAGMASGLRARPEPPTAYSTFVQSTQVGTFDLMLA